MSYAVLLFLEVMKMESCYKSGKILLKITCDENALTGISFCSDTAAETAVETNICKSPILALTEKWLDIYFSGNIPDFLPPLSLKGTDFQMRVWQKLCKIPYGKTVSYGALAKELAAETGKTKMSAQAVGNAVGKNPIAIIIPCHRVIGTDGSLTGFAGGLEVKKELLILENAKINIKK